MSRRDERGSASMELTLGIALLLVPVVMLVALLPSWLERHAVAGLLSREAARAFVLASDDSEARAAARTVAGLIAQDHRLTAGEWSLSLDGGLAPGAVVVARTRVRVPAVTLPALGQVGGFTVTAEHREVVDPYRSW